MRMIGVDVGGTFTDVIYVDTDTATTLIHKTPTTPENPAEGVVAGVAALCERHAIDPRSLSHVMHGTTIATNAVLEHRGARTAMVTTEGYRDILHIGRHQRPQHYSIMQEIPWQDRPLVKRRHRLTVRERLVPPHGEVLVPLDEDAVRDAARRLRDDGVEAVAVCFLFSYLNPQHEQRARALIEEEHPGCFVTTSSAVSPQFREFERFTTAAMNAFIGPTMRRYVGELEAGLRARSIDADLHIMGSHGGAASAALVCEHPVITLLSGPAAGVLGGGFSGRSLDAPNLVTFDVGGTSADIGIISAGQFAQATARDTWIAGYPVLAPMIDIHTIGAGGGSVAHLDAGGGLRVGPVSAGARPGPAAYGHGGDRPTVTDAQVVLGRLRSEHFLGGEMALDEPSARAVIEPFAEQVGLPLERTAAGILTVINANMANAIRSRTVQKGLDPRDFALVAFGGAGPLNAVEVARLLDIPRVIVPPYPGLTSALGLLTTDLRYDAVRTEFMTSEAPDPERLQRDFLAMEQQVRDQVHGEQPIRFRRSADLRYAGQGYELRVEVPDTAITPADVADVFQAFHEVHRAEFGHAFTDSVIEIVNIRVTGTRDVAKLDPAPVPGGDSVEGALVAERPCHFDTADGVVPLDTRFYRRHLLPLYTELQGPAIVVQTDSTTVVPPGASFHAEAGGNLVIRTGA